MKKNKILVLGLVAAFVAVLSLTLVSGTWAKYTSTVTGSDSARVAKWAVEYTEDTEDTTKIKVDLFKTAYASKANPTVNSVGSVAKTDKLIAPGTSGTAEFVLTNKSEVAAQAVVTLKLTNTGNLPVKFYTNSTKATSIEFDATTKKSTTTYQLALPTTADGTTQTVTIYWEWPFDQAAGSTNTDAQDTNLGTAETAATLQLDVEVVFEQVD